MYSNIHNGNIQPWKYSERAIICVIDLLPIIYINENYSCESAEMNNSTISAQVHARVLPVLPYDALEPALKRGGLFIVAMPRLFKLLVCHSRII